MANTTKIPLVSSEISGIWNSYIGENIFICLYKYFVNKVDDNEIHNLLQNALELSNQRISALTDIFNQEKLPVPEGLTDNDVNVNAPRLFTDAFYLQYLVYVSASAMRYYSLFLSHIARSDIRTYFSKCVSENLDLFNRSSEISLSKGVFVRNPHVEVPKEVEYVKDESFIVEWYGKKRPMVTDEISHIFSITNDTILRKAILTGFGQVCKDNNISDYISDSIDFATKQNDGFISLLKNEGILVGGSSNSYVTDSTVSPFSDKFIINKIMIMYRIKVANLGVALADMERSDLVATFIKYLNESTKQAKGAMDILINYGWFQQPPQAINQERIMRA